MSLLRPKNVSSILTTTEIIMKVSIIGNNKTFDLAKNIIRRSKESPCKCKICGAVAKYVYFGAISCAACKMFFKRNGVTGQKQLRCCYNGQCEIDMNNRHTCSFCRLAKCFANGMQTDLIRCPLSKQSITKREKKVTTIFNISVKKDEPQQLPTLNLLKLDQSSLTIDQRNLFFNLIHRYDEQSGRSLAERFISEQNTLPLKLRFKYGSVRDFIASLINKTQLLFEKNNDFLSLCSHDRSILLRRQMKHLALISFSFIVQQTYLIEYPAFCEVIKSHFGKTAMFTNKPATTLLTSDVSFLKLALTILSFSTFEYTVYQNIPADNLMNIKAIMEIQNRYIELAWQYLVYEYNDEQAVTYFTQLIRYIFTVNDTLTFMESEKDFTEITKSAIERTEQVLTFSI